MARKKKKTDLDIPDFLLVSNRPKQATKSGQAVVVPVPPEPWEVALEAIEPPEFREYVQYQMRRGRFERRWLVPSDRQTQRDVNDVLTAFRHKHEEQRERQEKRALKQAEKRNEPRGVARRRGVLRGMVPLSAVLKKMGDEAPRRRHAIAAVQAAKLDHIKMHFKNDPVTIAHLERALREYSPPVKEHKSKPTFNEAAVIRYVAKDNPKRPGTGAHERWELLRKCSGKTVGAFLEAGGNPVTLENAIKQGRAKLEEKNDAKSKNDSAGRSRSSRKKRR